MILIFLKKVRIRVSQIDSLNVGTITNLNLNFTNRLGPQPITIL
ncbi:hypothetical protein LEP1GSC073_3150 [Leptospira noguchii str. Cascata]|nr:hypothetical protein LEP1GSC073_3150 [Leptospira noguchii str. Cascata]